MDTKHNSIASGALQQRCFRYERCITELEIEVDKQRETISSQGTEIANLTDELERVREWLKKEKHGWRAFPWIQHLFQQQIASIDDTLKKLVD